MVKEIAISYRREVYSIEEKYEKVDYQVFRV
jgi:hypothetical protein